MSNHRKLHDDDSGVSTVIGAILVSALVVMVLVTIRVNFVPQWDEADDQEHLSAISNDMAQLRASLDRQLDDPTSNAVTVPLALEGRSGGNAFFGSSRLASELNYLGENKTAISLAAPQLVIRQAAESSLEAINENWQSVITNGSVSNVEDVSHLRLRLTNPASGNDNDGITLTITDASGNFAGSLQYYTERVSSSYAVNAMVRNADNTIIFDGGEVAHHNYAPTYAWLNALDPSIFFEQVLAAAEGPFNLTMTQSGLIGDFAITYTEATPGGPVTQGGSGLVINNYGSNLGGGRLEMAWRPSALPQQTIVYEHGALFRVQDDGAAIMAPPNIRYVPTANGNYFQIDLPMLGGGADSRTGGTVPMQFIVDKRVTVDGSANSFDLTLQTAYPLQWSEVFYSAAAKGGVPLTDYSVTVAPGQVTLHLEGPSSDPAVKDLSLKIRQASILTTFPN